jgi:RNHCP domain
VCPECPSAASLSSSLDGRRSSEDIPLPRLHLGDLDRLLSPDDDPPIPVTDHRDRPNRSPTRGARPHRPADSVDHRLARPRTRANERGSFKCGRCRAFVGPTVSGGRHRNHCPLCLTSRHVDDRRPGDRASPCRALMPPVGTFFRPKGEQVVLHRCNGCGVERHNRIAADDNPLALLRLPLVPPRLGGRHGGAMDGPPTPAWADGGTTPFPGAPAAEDRETG